MLLLLESMVFCIWVQGATSSWWALSQKAIEVRGPEIKLLEVLMTFDLIWFSSKARPSETGGSRWPVSRTRFSCTLQHRLHVQHQVNPNNPQDL